MTKTGIVSRIKNDNEIVVSVVGEDKEITITAPKEEITFLRDIIEDAEVITVSFDSESKCLVETTA